ncbi:AraC family transcriptional regulator [Chryseobacterium oranimense]|uniref:helix-turn-helix domain-containing protein n=1 Tax=Chryseobacterium oranimense TaxID=421058 RepID=UPI0021AF6069|nr:AraC family transcriptional regulator [Chryseobacterium oranimense]UWX58859.1 AraC family transcriptional regulator [Chryseobacterium oranimense]
MILYNDGISHKPEDNLKRRCLSLIVYVLCVALCIYSIIVYITLNDRDLAIAIFVYFLVLLCAFFLIRKNYRIKTLVHFYLIFDPLFAAFAMLYFWRYSAGTALWVLPIPVGAYVFLERKYVYIYTSYVLLIVLLVTFLSKFLTHKTPNFNEIDFSDAIVGAANIIIVALLLYYNDKIKSVKIMANFVQDINHNSMTKLETEINRNGNEILKKDFSGYDKDIDKYNEIFQNVKSIVEEQLYFKDADFTISRLSHLLKINNLYIAKSIKLNGYSSFSHYINSCRIRYVKELINENNLSKITLMYIYTSSGFSSQSTFNRVFKQIEGVTPTEYIYNLKKNVK